MVEANYPTDHQSGGVGLIYPVFDHRSDGVGTR
jgi:hypothetical protein